jgi:hypothetical protein
MVLKEVCVGPLAGSFVEGALFGVPVRHSSSLDNTAVADALSMLVRGASGPAAVMVAL